ncbi:hypothetical protein ACLOJK_013366 [Asimina triloba]
MSIPTVRSSPSSDSFLQFASIPFIDLRFLSQSELNSLALCSNDSFDLRRCDDVVVPKIDRTIFNESAGSRKQTYSRLRLARGPAEDVSAAARPHRLPPTASHHLPLNASDDAERLENKQIIAYLRKLFVGEGAGAAPAELPNGKRQRVPEVESGMNSAVVARENGFQIVNRKGTVIDAVALAEKDELFSMEVRRRTEGLATETALLQYLEGLEGQWGSRRKKRKIIDAADFGDELPRGWKILLGLKRKEGQVWLACRKYIRLETSLLGCYFEFLVTWYSPLNANSTTGSLFLDLLSGSGMSSNQEIYDVIEIGYLNAFRQQQAGGWETGRKRKGKGEVSSYLLSIARPQDANQLTSSHIDESTKGSYKLPPGNFNLIPQDLLGVQQTAGTNHNGDSIKEDSICYSAVPISSVSVDYEKQIPLFKVQNTVGVDQQNLLECRKCQLTFAEKGAYVQHLLSFHRRKAKRWGLVKSISDGVIIKDGKYECQFCHKTFDEKHRYRGHVGVHAKYYVKGIGASPNELTAVSSTNPSPLAQTPLIASEIDALMDEKDSAPETSTPKSSDDLNDESPHDEQDTMGMEFGNIPIFVGAEDSHERKPVEKKEILMDLTADKSIGIVDTIHSLEIKADACTDSANPFHVKEQNIMHEASHEVDFSHSAMLDKIDKHGMEKGKNHEYYSFLPHGNEKSCGDQSNGGGNLTACKSDHMLDERKQFSSEMERGHESCSVTFPTSDISDYVSGLFSVSGKESAFNETERPREEPQNNFVRSHPGLDRATEMESGHESCSVAFSDNGQTCDISAYVSGLFSVRGEESAFNETERPGDEPENGFVRNHHGLDKATVLEIFGSTDEDDVMQNVVNDASLSAQPSDCSPSLNMAPDKREDGFNIVGQKLDKISGYQELRLDDIDPQKYGLATAQDSASLPEAPIDLAYCAELEGGLNNSVEFSWDTVLPKMDGDHQLTTVCVWCGMEFDNGGVDTEPQSDSVGFMCPTCKAKISGQYNVF